MNIRMVVRSLAIVSLAYAIAAGAAESPAPATAPAAVEKADPKALVLELQRMWPHFAVCRSKPM